MTRPAAAALGAHPPNTPVQRPAAPSMRRRFADLHRPRLQNRAMDWPADGRARLALQLLLALPFLALALLSSAFDAETPNQGLVQRASGISWDRADPAWVGQLYPPITTLLGAVVPGDEVGLAIVGALLAGVLLHRVTESMRRRGFALSTTVIFTVALAANPLFAYAATQGLPAFVGIGCFGLGFADLVRFTTERDTQSGFRAGILLMLAALSDPSGIVYVLVATIAAPLLSLGRARRGSSGANALVVLFPTFAAFGTVILLDGIFTGRPLDVLRRIVSIDDTRLDIFRTLFTTELGWLWLASMAGVWAIALVARRPGGVVLSLLLFSAIFGGYLVGLNPNSAAGTIYLMMMLTAIGLVPAASRGRLAVIVNAIVLLELAIAWSTSFHRPVVREWLDSLAAAFAALV